MTTQVNSLVNSKRTSPTPANDTADERSTTPPLDANGEPRDPPRTDPPPPPRAEQELGDRTGGYPGGYAGGYTGGYPGGYPAGHPGSYPGVYGLPRPGGTIYHGLATPDGSQMLPPMQPVALPVLPTVTEHQITESGKYVFDMRIIHEKLANTTMAADPKMAANNLSIMLQLKLSEIAKVTVGPLDVRVHYEQHPNRMFVCAVPRCLEAHVIHLAFHLREVNATGDDLGNKYKLAFAEHNDREYKQIIKKADDRCWFHIISTAPDCTMSTREIYKAANDKLSKWGFTLNPETFKNLPDSSQERGSGKYHADYDLDWNHIQIASGAEYDDREIDLSKLSLFNVEDMHGKIWPMKVWFKPEVFYAIFGNRNCAKCYKGARMCQCHLEQIKKLSGKKRAAEREEAYAKRKAKVAAMSFDF